MGTPFLGELRIVAFNFAPKGWAECNGQFLPINQNQALFSLLGTMYGGNGQTTFALPDLRGRTPLHVGSGFIQGQAGGQEAHTITMAEMPAHNHFVQASKNNGDSQTGAGLVLGQVAGRLYTDPPGNTTLAPGTIGNVGGNQPHENRQPFTVLNVVIALQGIFPSRN
jgi:microcystin-dependent protein